MHGLSKHGVDCGIFSMEQESAIFVSMHPQ